MASKGRLHMQRRVAIEGAVIGREQIIEERELRSDGVELAPEAQAVETLATGGAVAIEGEEGSAGEGHGRLDGGG
jgi:hypothetical protein